MQEAKFDHTFYRSILDAMPVPVFVVDDDMRVIDINRTASIVFRMELPAVIHQRGGQALHCVHATDVPAGCGRGPFCKSCVVRNSVNESMKGGTISRRRTKVEIRLGDKTRKLDILVTASPVPGPDRLSLLILEDISEIIRLRDLIPICPRCKSTREDDEYWIEVKSYFIENAGARRGENVCPDCRKTLYPELARVRTSEPQPILDHD